jgi:electron transport complex protein RnfA
MLIGAVLVNNVILVQFLGICPFLGVSNKVSTASGMGAAVIFVMTMSTLVTSLLYNYVLIPFGIVFLKTITFIIIIATLVQMLEIILKKVSAALYHALGVYLPLITTNCAVLGVAISVTQKNFSLIDGVLYTIFTAIGFAMAIIIFAGIREQMELSKIPKVMHGVPISLVTAGILAMAFMGFSGIV